MKSQINYKDCLKSRISTDITINQTKISKKSQMYRTISRSDFRSSFRNLFLYILFFLSEFFIN